MNKAPNNTASGDSRTLAGLLTGRYGALALTRAAGEAASAARKGDSEQIALWKSVIADLRQAMTGVPESA